MRPTFALQILLSILTGSPSSAQVSEWWIEIALVPVADAPPLREGTAAPILAAIRKEILSVPELDATWVDSRQIGKPYGTAMALLPLAMTPPQ